ncbi:MAG: hypothetical protein ACON4J_03310 [Parvibaculales bacterium]
MSKSESPRRLAEPGGIWLIVLGLPNDRVEELIRGVRGRFTDISITVLIEPQQKSAATAADEVWVFNRLGPAGLLALLRRASWRHFDRVYHFPDLSGTRRHAWLKWLIWPRPDWISVDVTDMSGLDLRAG